MRKPLQHKQQHGDPGRVLVDESEEGAEMVCVPDGVGAAETVRFVCSAEVSRGEFDLEDEDENDEAYARTDNDLPGDNVLYEPGVKVPYSGVYVMVNPTGEVTDTERTAVRGGRFPPTGRPGQAYRLARAAHNAVGGK